MSTAPLITTVIPTYRRPQLLRRAIDSALAQRHPHLRVCVYDNASGDETEAVVREIAQRDPRVTYHRHPQNIGAYANFRYAMEHVETPYFSLLSDDDLLLDGFYERALHDLERHPDAMFWAGAAISMSPDGEVYGAGIDDWPRTGLLAPPDGALAMARGAQLCWTGIAFRREVVTDVGLLDEAIGGPADFDYLLRAASKHPYVASTHPAAIFLLNPDSFSATMPLSAFWPGWHRLIEKAATWEHLDAATRRAIGEALEAKARRMLFRRAAAALAERNLRFASNAEAVLRDHYRDRTRAALLDSIGTMCAHSGIAQNAYTQAYRFAERMILSRRGEARAKYQKYAELLRR